MTKCIGDAVDWSSVPGEALRSFDIGGLRVVPNPAGESWGDATLGVEVGDAFGSGWHPTTRLCLERAFEVPLDRPVLDFGSGTGIVALAAIKLGAPSALGIEVDSTSLAVAGRNAARNGLASSVNWARRVPSNRLFGWVVANVLTAPLLEHAESLVSAVDRGGELSLSGLGMDQTERVIRRYRHAGCRLLQVVERDEWVRIDLSGPW